MMPASVYLGNLPPGISKDDIFSHLSMFGTITAVDILQGYGFVEFATESEAMDVVDRFSNEPLLGIKVQLARNRRRRGGGGDNRPYRSPSPRRDRPAHPQMTRPPPSPDLLRMRFPVIVHPLSRVTCWQELKDFGRLAGGVVAFCDVDKVRARGFIEYLSREDAERAVAELSGRELNGSIVTLTLGWSQQGRSRSRSPPRQRERETRRPHPYNDPRPPSGPYDYGRGGYRSDDYRQPDYQGQDQGRRYTSTNEGSYAAPPPPSHNYSYDHSSRGTWGTEYSTYGEGPSRTYTSEPQPMHTAQQPYGYPPQAPQVPQAPQAPPTDVPDVGHRFSEMFESPSWTDSTASKQLYQNQEYLQKILDMVKQGTAQGPST